MPNKDYKRYYGTVNPSDDTKQVEFLDLVLCVDDTVSRDEDNNDAPFYFTDMQFQPGDTLTGWVPNTREMLKRQTNISDETSTLPVNDPYVEEGSAAQTLNLDTRCYNIMGRGHQVITLPNYYPDDWDVEILPAGVDFTIYPKDDFDLCRISTASGVLLEPGGRVYDKIMEDNPDDSGIQSLFNNHPLHYKYTREFWVDGAAADTEIKIHASTIIAEVDGTPIPLAGERFVNINNNPFYIGRRRFLLAPSGSAKFRIEFYKIAYTSGGIAYLKDVGIGFYGTAEFMQWTYGRSRI